MDILCYGYSLFMDIPWLCIFFVYYGYSLFMVKGNIFFQFSIFFPSLLQFFVLGFRKKKLSIFNVYVAPGRGFLSRVQQNLGLPVIKYRDRVQKQAKPWSGSETDKVRNILTPRGELENLEMHEIKNNIFFLKMKLFEKLLEL